MKKQPCTLLAVAVILLGISFAIPSTIGVVSYAQYYLDYLFVPLIPLSLSLGIVILGICIEIKKRNLQSLMKTGMKSICFVEEYRLSGGLLYKNYSLMFVTYMGESGKMYTQKVYCSIEDHNKHKKGTKIVCYIKGEKCYVPKSSVSRRVYK